MTNANLFGGTMLVLLALVSTKAFAAPPVCTAVVPCEDVVPADCGAANDEACTPATDVDLDGYYSDSSSMLDCDDANSSVYPGALSVIGDGLDNGCTGEKTDPDGKELAAALAAAGGEDSPKGIKLLRDITICKDGQTDGTFVNVWSYDAGWDCRVADGFSYERGHGVRNRSETHAVETARRIAGDKRAVASAKAAALAEIEAAKADLSAKVSELGHPADNSDPENPVAATGLYAALDANLAAVATANGAAKTYLDEQIAENRKEIGKATGEVLVLKERVRLILGRLEVVESDVGDLKQSGVIGGFSLGGMLLADSPLLTGENGTTVAGGLESGVTLGLYVGGENPHSRFVLDGSVEQGSTESDGGTIPVTLFTVGGALSYRKDDMSVGGKLAVFGGSSGDITAPQSSHVGAAFGPTASWSPRISNGMCSGVTTFLGGGVESLGSEIDGSEFRTVSPVFVGSVSINLGICPGAPDKK